MIARFMLMAMLIAGPAFAVQPGEELSDPALESRARDLSQNLRCLVCRNENIDESDADLARDLRLLVRERIVAGDTDDEVIAFVVERYGEYVLLNPTATGSTLILWLAGPAMLIGAGVVAGLTLHRRRAHPDVPLSQDEQARLDKILGR